MSWLIEQIKTFFSQGMVSLNNIVRQGIESLAPAIATPASSSPAISILSGIAVVILHIIKILSTSAVIA